MGVQAKRMGETLVVRLDGELDLHTAASFKETVAQSFAEWPQVRHLVLAMDEVTFVDSSGVGAILGRYREISNRGGRLAVAGLQVPVRKVFELSGMTKLISVHDSEGQALASM